MESQTFNKKLNFDKVFIDYIAGTISGTFFIFFIHI